MKQINQYLEKLIELVEAEKQEEIKEFESMNTGDIFEMRQNGYARYPLNITDQFFNKGEKLLVKLENSDNQSYKCINLFKSGRIIKIFAKDNPNEDFVTGVINNSSSSHITITLNCDSMQDWMLNKNLVAVLMFDNTTYEQTILAINTLINTQDEHLIKLKEIFYKQGKEEFLEKEFTPNNSLNPTQNKALKLINDALDVAIVHGPPGTGKTTVLTSSAIMEAESKKKILMVAPSNAAVDNIAINLLKKNYNVVRIGNPARVDDEILQTTLDYKIANHPDYKNIKMLRKKADEYRKMARKYKRNFGPEEREQRNLLLGEVKQITKQADQLAFYIISDIIGKAKIICTTPVGSTYKEIASLKFDTLYIDEATQCLEPMCFIPIIRANKIVFAGDHHQLMPTIKSKKAIEGGLNTTLFEKLIKKLNCNVMLNEQYRMHEKIMGFSNQKFYNNQLFASNENKNHLIYQEDDAFVFCDTAGTGFMEEQEDKTFSTFNNEEANLVFRYLNNYVMILESIGKASNLKSIGIISPYKAQCTCLTEELKNSTLPDYIKQIIQIDTVDAFQGREKDMILISMTRSNEKGEIGFLNDHKRMNVALTRAKKKLVVFADSATISHSKFYQDFLDYVSENCVYMSAFEVE